MLCLYINKYRNGIIGLKFKYGTPLDNIGSASNSCSCSFGLVLKCFWNFTTPPLSSLPPSTQTSSQRQPCFTPVVSRLIPAASERNSWYLGARLLILHPLEASAPSTGFRTLRRQRWMAVTACSSPIIVHIV